MLHVTECQVSVRGKKGAAVADAAAVDELAAMAEEPEPSPAKGARSRSASQISRQVDDMMSNRKGNNRRCSISVPTLLKRCSDIVNTGDSPVPTPSVDELLKQHALKPTLDGYQVPCKQHVHPSSNAVFRKRPPSDMR